MFDSLSDPVVVDDWPDGHALDDAGPAPWDPGFAGWFEELCARDPERPRPAGELLADAVSAPVPAGLVGVDVSGLSEAELVALGVGAQRGVNVFHGVRAAAVAEFTARMAASPVSDRAGRRRVEVFSPAQLAVAELAPALGVGVAAGQLLVDVAAGCRQRFPDVWRLLTTGTVAWEKVVVLVEATGWLSDAQAAAVQARVLAGMAGRSVPNHRAAVRRAVEAVDPDGIERRRRLARRDIRLARRHLGDGMGELYANLPVEALDTIFTAADTAARRAKAGGDHRSLDTLRVTYLIESAVAFLTGQPFTGITVQTPDDDGGPDDSGPDGDGPGDGPDAAVPRRHGRAVRVRVVWDLTGLLGVTGHGGRLADSDAGLPASAIRELITGRGVRVRRLLHDDVDGQLRDLTPRSWRLGRRGRTPYLLDLTIPVWLHRALRTGDAGGLTDVQRELLTRVTAALDATDASTRAVLAELLGYPVTAHTLDDHPDAATPSPALAEFVACHAGHPANPAAGPTPAGAGDLDHHTPRSAGGQTVRANLGPFTRRWHRLKTFAGWTVSNTPHGWEWTSPTGHRHTVEPHDYRLGP